MWPALCFLWQKFLFDQPLDVARIDCEQHVSTRFKSTPLHTRVQPEQSFDDALHLRCVIRGSYCTDVELLSFFFDLHWTTGLNHRLLPTPMKPHPARFCVRVSSPADPSVNVQCKGRNLTEPQFLTKRATAPIQLLAHCIVECDVIVAFPSDWFPDVFFPLCFPVAFPDGGRESPVIRCSSR